MTHVFVSSTQKDLILHRKAVFAALRQAGFDVIAMEDFGAQPDDASRVSEQELMRADVVVGIYALRYGYCPDNSLKSVTEMEYDWSVQHQKPLFCFILDEVGYNAYDTGHETLIYELEDPEMRSRLQAFKARVMKEKVVKSFTTPDKLATDVVSSLLRWIQIADRSAPSPKPSIHSEIDVGENKGIVIGSISGGKNKIENSKD